MKNKKKILAKSILLFLLLVSSFFTNAQSIQGIVNSYTPIITMRECCDTITVSDASSFNSGDRVLIIQMKGAMPKQTLANYGNLASNDYGGAGLCELGTIDHISGNEIKLKKVPYQHYDLINGSVQLVRVQTGVNISISNTVTCPPWNGSTGGIVVIESSNSIILNNDINVDGMGFRGGYYNSFHQGVIACANDNKRRRFNDQRYGNKGEGIGAPILWGSTSDGNGSGLGAFANAGGGGGDHNAGGAGGANGGVGGKGGMEWGTCNPMPANNGGFGGNNLNNSPPCRFYMGGGGGAGHCNNNAGKNGGSGGGIIILITNTIISNGGILRLEGETPDPSSDDGASGGGAGGTLYIKANSYSGSSTFIPFITDGGNGGNVNNPVWQSGPGGGGGGGVYIYSPAISSAFTPISSVSQAGLDARTVANFPSQDPHRMASSGGPSIQKSFFDIKEGYIPKCLADTVLISECQGKPITLTAPSNPFAKYYYYDVPNWYATSSPNRIINTQTGTYVMKTVLENDCECTRVYIVTAIPPDTIRDTITINCGDSIDLDDYIVCSQFGFAWESNYSYSLFSTVVQPNGTTLYNRRGFSDSTYSCQHCIDELLVQVLPLPIDTITIEACFNEIITLAADTNGCNVSNYTWEGPSGLILHNAATLQVAATTGFYSVSGLLPNGCECKRVFNVIANKKVNYVSVLACLNENITLDALCGSSTPYSWQTPTGPMPWWYTHSNLNITATSSTSLYSATTTLPNGCICETKFDINVNVPIRDTVHVDVNCGGTYDLSQIQSPCNGHPTNWIDVDNMQTLLSPIITVNNSGTYELNTFRDASLNCLICVTTVILNMTRVTDTVDTTSCISDTLVLMPSNVCGTPAGVTWYGPNGPILSLSGNPPLPVIVTNTVQTYIAEAYMPNGCICIRVYNVGPLQPVVENRTISVDCGTIIHLEDYDSCNTSLYQWFDAATNLPVSINQTISKQRQYYRIGYSNSPQACAVCTLNLVVNVIQPAPTRDTFITHCSGDGLLISGCSGTEYIWFDASNNRITNASSQTLFLYPVPTDTVEYTVKAKSLDSCWCTTIITVIPHGIVTQYNNLTVNLNCGDQIDLDNYDSCNSTNQWSDSLGIGVSNTVIRFNSSAKYSKKTYDAVTGCETCVTELHVKVSDPNPTIHHDTDTVHIMCHGETYDPPYLCQSLPPNYTYKWYDDVDFHIDSSANLLFDNTPFVGLVTINGYYSRYIYDQYGCLYCIEAYKIRSFPMVTTVAEAAIIPDTVEICETLTQCRTASFLTYPLMDIPNTYCTWTPSLNQLSLSSLQFCPPFTNGQLFTKRCYSDNGCLVYVAKVWMRYCEGLSKPGKALGVNSSINNQLSIETYPNPFNDEINIKFNLQASTEASINIVDVMGRVVYTLGSEQYTSGQNSVIIKTNGFVPGVYTLTIKTDSGVYSHKMICNK